MESIQHVQPLLIMLSLVDLIKKKWDVDHLQLHTSTEQMNIATYLQKLTEAYLIKENIEEVANDCQTLFEVYKDKLLKLESIEAYLEQLNLKD